MTDEELDKNLLERYKRREALIREITILQTNLRKAGVGLATLGSKLNADPEDVKPSVRENTFELNTEKSIYVDWDGLRRSLAEYHDAIRELEGINNDLNPNLIRIDV